MGVGILEVLIVLLIAAAAIHRLRRLRWLGFCFPRSVPPPEGRMAMPSHRVRLTEALLLAVTGALVWFSASSHQGNGGYLLHLSGMPRPLVIAQVLLAAGVLLAIAGGVFLAWRGRSQLGTLIVAASVLGYMFTLQGCSSTRRHLDPRYSVIPDTLYIFRVSGDLDGAELWINDTYLGRTPVRIRASELQQKVPAWPEKDRSKIENPELPTAVSAVPAPTDVVHGEVKWFHSQLPHHTANPKTGLSDTTWRSCYVRIRLGGEWGVISSSGGGGGDDEFSQSFGAEFPQLEARKRNLMDQARLADYRPSPEWFSAIETYGLHGWALLQQAAAADEGFRQVADQWAARRYALDQVKDAASAWALFERIGQESDEARVYDSNGMEGRAVERVAPLLDPDRLISRAEEIIPRVSGYRCSLSGLRVEAVSESQSRDGKALRPQDGALAHALWLLDQRLDAEGAPHPNLVEKRLIPALLRRNPHGDMELRLCVTLGGPQIEQYLLRQDWRKNIDGIQHGFEDGTYLSGAFVNKWALLLAGLSTPVGRDFRQAHQPQLLAMTASIQEKSISWDVGRDLNYLFLDNDLGGNSLAAAYWPRFSEKVRAQSGAAPSALQRQWQYLVRMEPLPTADEYVECWAKTPQSAIWSSNALPILQSLPDEKRRTVLQGIQTLLLPQKGKDAWAEPALRNIDTLLRADSPDAQAQFIVQEAQKPAGQRLSEVKDLLEGRRSDDRAIHSLATSESEPARILACQAIQAHPTPANRALLAKLLSDPSPDIRAAPEKAANALNDLAKTPPEELSYVGR